jgi:ATPase subunit of ABC transporter with duplicated ATPase domains
MRYKATKAKAAQNMAKRAERLLSGLEEVRAVRQGGQAALPEPAPCGKTPLMASGLSKSYGSLEVFTDVDLAIDRGRGWSCSASTARARPRCCASSPASSRPTPARSSRATG